jgi:hypothetical protein
MTRAFRFGTGSRAELATVHPQLQAMAHRALELSPVDFRVLQGIRTAAEQLAAYKSGHSKIRSGGRHQFGCAIDVIAIDPEDRQGNVEADQPIYADQDGVSEGQQGTRHARIHRRRWPAEQRQAPARP